MKILKNLLVLFGLIFVIWLIVDTGPDKIWGEIKNIGPLYILLFLLPYLGVYLLDGLGWKYSFCREVKIPFVKLFSVRLAGEAVNHITPTAYLGGEPVKAYMLYKNNGVSLAHGLASVIIGKFLLVATEVIFILIGIKFAVDFLGTRGSLVWGIELSIAFLGALLIAFFILQIHGVGKFFSHWIRRLKLFTNLLEKHQESIEKFDEIIASYYRDNKLSFVMASSFYLLSWFCGIFEIYIVLKITGCDVAFTTVIAMEAIAVAIKGAGFFIPGSLGVQEAGQVGLFVLFGFSQSIGVTFSILRRLREILWVIIGVMILGKDWEQKFLV